MGIEDQVKILPVVLDEYVHHVAVSKQLPREIKATLTRAVERLEEAGRLREISERYIQ